MKYCVILGFIFFAGIHAAYNDSALTLAIKGFDKATENLLPTTIPGIISLGTWSFFPEIGGQLHCVKNIADMLVAYQPNNGTRLEFDDRKTKAYAGGYTAGNMINVGAHVLAAILIKCLLTMLEVRCRPLDVTVEQADDAIKLFTKVLKWGEISMLMPLALKFLATAYEFMRS